MANSRWNWLCQQWNVDTSDHAAVVRFIERINQLLLQQDHRYNPAPMPIEQCECCKDTRGNPFSDPIDRRIYHNNGHVWPGFAGDP